MFFESIAHAMGPAPGGAGGAASGTDMLVQFVPIIIMLGIFWFFLIRPKQKEAKARQAMIDSLKRGDYIVTASGLIGRIIELDAHVATIECDKSTLRILRVYIAGLYNDSGNAPAPAAEEKKG